MPAKPAMPHILLYYVASGRRVAEAASILGLKFGVLSVRLFSGWFLRLSVLCARPHRSSHGRSGTNPQDTEISWNQGLLN